MSLGYAGRLVCIVALAAANQQVRAGDEISGIVIDNSVSVLAQDFATGFRQVWHQQSRAEKHSVVLEEQTSALRGNQITVSHGNRILYRSSLNRRSDNTEYGRNAAQEVIKQLRRIGFTMSDNKDMAEDEF